MKRGMRVTGGMYLGRRVSCPPGVIRPAMDRMRESVFAVLGDLSESSFLDLFSGSGIVGIEAASRGASAITFVEKDRRKIPVIKSNTAFVTADVHIICNSVERFLVTNGNRYDTIFVDPPFDYPRKHVLLEIIDRENTLNAGGTLLIHFPAEDALPETAGELTMYDRRKYGRSIVGFFARVDKPES